MKTGHSTTIYFNGDNYDVNYGGEEVVLSEDQFKRDFMGFDFREMSAEDYSR